MTVPTRDGGPAFPNFRESDDRSLVHEKDGMSLRDYIAVAVLQGFGTWMPVGSGNLSSGDALKARAAVAYLQADLMLEERRRRYG